MCGGTWVYIIFICSFIISVKGEKTVTLSDDYIKIKPQKRHCSYDSLSLHFSLKNHTCENGIWTILEDVNIDAGGGIGIHDDIVFEKGFNIVNTTFWFYVSKEHSSLEPYTSGSLKFEECGTFSSKLVLALNFEPTNIITLNNIISFTCIPSASSIPLILDIEIKEQIYKYTDDTSFPSGNSPTEDPNPIWKLICKYDVPFNIENNGTFSIKIGPCTKGSAIGDSDNSDIESPLVISLIVLVVCLFTVLYICICNFGICCFGVVIGWGIGLYGYRYWPRKHRIDSTTDMFPI